MRIRFPRGGWFSGQRPGRMGRWLLSRPRMLAVGLTLVSVLAWAGFVACLWFAWDVRQSLPDRKALSSVGDMAQATTLFDQSDKPVFTIFKEQRIEVPLEKMSRNFREAVVSVEDQRFYEHSGIDVVRIGAAVLANVRSGTRGQGGSTITQQLARMSFLNRKKTYTRKVKEAFAALLIERTYSKDEILALYLNKAYFGDGYHGVEAASLGFFGKHASELDVPEAALIAGLIQSPSAYAPTINMEKAITRRNIVLYMMLENRVIDRPAYEQREAGPRSNRERSASRRAVRSLFQGSRPARTGRPLRLAACLRGRAQGLHHDRPRPATAGRGHSRAPVGGNRAASRVSAHATGEDHHHRGRRAAVPAGRRGGDGPTHRRGPRASGRAQLPRVSLQSRGAGATAVRLGVQADRVRHGDRAGPVAGIDRVQPQRPDQHALGRLRARGRTLRRRQHDAADGPPYVEQSRRGAVAADRRHSGGRQDGAGAVARTDAGGAVDGARGR